MNPLPYQAFGLYLVLTEPVAGYEACTAAAVQAGVRYVQLRRKNRPRQDTLDIARRLRRITAGTSTLFIVNDDVEIAAESDADGVHLGQQDLPAPEARKIVGVDAIVGVTTHNLEQARQAVLDGALDGFMEAFLREKQE